MQNRPVIHFLALLDYFFEFFFPLKDLTVLDIVLLFGNGFLQNRLLDLFLSVHELVKANFHRRADHIESLISGEEGGEKNFAINCGDGDRVVKDDCVGALFDLPDVLLGDVEESLPKKDVLGVELRKEAESLVRNKESP